MGQTPVKTRTDLLDLHVKVCQEALVLMKAKNADYADEDSPYANFDSVEAVFRGKITAGQDIITRMAEKVCRLATASMRPLKVKDEDIRATGRDLINYVILFIGEQSRHLPPSKPEKATSGAASFHPVPSHPCIDEFTGGKSSGFEGV